MKKLLGLALVSAAIFGCGNQAAVEPAPAGAVTDAPIKGGQGGAKGMSASDLSAPPGSEGANMPGTKAGG